MYSKLFRIKYMSFGCGNVFYSCVKFDGCSFIWIDLCQYQSSDNYRMLYDAYIIVLYVYYLVTYDVFVSRATKEKIMSVFYIFFFFFKE